MYKCPFCDEKFASKMGLQMHIFSQHRELIIEQKPSIKTTTPTKFFIPTINSIKTEKVIQRKPTDKSPKKQVRRRVNELYELLSEFIGEEIVIITRKGTRIEGHLKKYLKSMVLLENASIYEKDKIIGEIEKFVIRLNEISHLFTKPKIDKKKDN